MGKIVLYIHGMGGGADSRIPSILNDYFSYPIGQLSAEAAALGYNPLRGSTFASASADHCHPAPQCHFERSEESPEEPAVSAAVRVVARTYDFDPEVAAEQIGKWVEELKPDLVIGESLGALQAMRIKNVPMLFVSPALNAPFHFQIMAWLSLIPGMTLLFDRIYRPREGDRQKLHFTFKLLRKYRAHRKIAIETALSRKSDQPFYAFFGTRDHYRKYGVVSIRTWEKYFGRTYNVYDGTHFMEDEPIRQYLVPWIIYLLKI